MKTSSILDTNACVVCGRSLRAHRDRHNGSLTCAEASRREQPLEAFQSPTPQPVGHLVLVHGTRERLRREDIR